MVDLPHRLGKYTLQRRIGSGGMGRVYLANLEGAGGFTREIAVKLVRPELSASTRATDLFLREGRALAALSHRNIVQVFELDAEGEQLYLAMEYLRGLDLGQIRARGPVSWPAAVYIASEAARGLAAAHNARSVDAPDGIVHGDISPSNVMACFDGAVKVLDFGIARPLGLASTAGVGGKLPYLPPEVIVGSAPDERADIYALGLVLYELLVGERLFRATSDSEIMHRVMQETVVAPAARIEGIPRALDALVMRSIARDLFTRPASAGELADALDRIVERSFGATDLATLVESLATRPSELGHEALTPVGRTEAFALHRTGGLTAPVTASVLSRVPKRTRRWGLIAGLVGAAVTATVILQIRTRPVQRAAEPEVNVVPVLRVENRAPTSPPVAAPRTPSPPLAAPVATPVPAEVATVKPGRAHVYKRARPIAAPLAPEHQGSGSISPGYLANPFGDKR